MRAQYLHTVREGKLKDEAWKEQVRTHKGIVLSIDGIQPDKGNETISLLRDVLTGRSLHAENVTESTKERLKQLLAPASWRPVRQETRDCHREQLNRFRFRHRPLDDLASLERRWEQITSTEVLPP